MGPGPQPYKGHRTLCDFGPTRSPTIVLNKTARTILYTISTENNLYAPFLFRTTVRSRVGPKSYSVRWPLGNSLFALVNSMRAHNFLPPPPPQMKILDPFLESLSNFMKEWMHAGFDSRADSGMFNRISSFAPTCGLGQLKNTPPLGYHVKRRSRVKGRYTSSILMNASYIK